LVATVASAVLRKSAVWKSSGCMIPAMVISTFVSGKRVRTVSAAAVTEAGSAVSITTDSMPGCSAVIRRSSSSRRPPTMTLLPAAWKRRARPRPIPDVAPGMKMVFPELFMVPVDPTA
jgi:hypothetical protein